MTRSCLLLFSFSLVVSLTSVKCVNAQVSQTPVSPPNSLKITKRGPLLRPFPDQIKQAQKILKARGFYSGQENGRLDKPTRASIIKYQQAEKLKTTGSLNAETLTKMKIQLTSQQKAVADRLAKT
jgi:peptidoglycan hydrolase-like protein with peptidoglycan-binding domain